jgi:hypothetical protein
MDNRNEKLRTYAIVLAGAGLFLMGIGAILHVFHEFNMSRAFVRNMENMSSRVVSDMMSTNGPSSISVSDEDGRPWITIENKDKTKAEFYRISETNTENRRDVISFLRNHSQQLQSTEEQEQPEHIGAP